MADPTLADVLAAISKLSEQNEKQADANAAKTTAEAEKIRDEVARSAAGAQTALDLARADLNARQVANAEKVAGLVTAGVPDVASLPRNGISFAAGRGLRQGEATALALDAAAEQVAEAVRTVTAEGSVVHLTADAHLLERCVAHRLLTSELQVATGKLQAAVAAATQALPPQEAITTETIDPLTGAAVAAGVTGAALKQVLSLFDVETSARQDQSTIPAQAVHGAVAAKLLRAQRTVRHLTLRVVDPATTPLLSGVTALLAIQADAAAALAALTAAESDAKAADPQQPATLAELARLRTDLEAMTTFAKAFLTRVTTPSAEGDSPLASAVAVGDLFEGNPRPFVLVATGADAEAAQLVVARRLWWPRVTTSVSVSFDYFLVQGSDLSAAGRAHGAHAFHGRLKGDGAAWSKLDPLPPTPEPARSAEPDNYAAAG